MMKKTRMRKVTITATVNFLVLLFEVVSAESVSRRVY
jgi:hypothetical protein